MGEKLKKVSKTKKPEKKPEKKLTEKEKLFCQVYINNFNAASAVVKAGYQVKDRNSASCIGYQLLQKTTVKAEITRLKRDKMKSLNLSKDDIVERQMRIAFADMTDFIDFGQEKVPVMSMFGPVKIINPITGFEENEMKEVNYIKFKEGSMVDGAIIAQVKQGKEGASIKLEDRQRALEWLADYFEMNPMNQHKRDFDNKKLELEKAKWDAELQRSQPDTGETENDGFIDALNASAKEVWADEVDSEISEESGI